MITTNVITPVSPTGARKGKCCTQRAKASNRISLKTSETPKCSRLLNMMTKTKGLTDPCDFLGLRPSNYPCGVLVDPYHVEVLVASRLPGRTAEENPILSTFLLKCLLAQLQIVTKVWFLKLTQTIDPKTGEGTLPGAMGASHPKTPSCLFWGRDRAPAEDKDFSGGSSTPSGIREQRGRSMRWLLWGLRQRSCPRVIWPNITRR